jgi:hypothetical protein
MVSSKWLNGLEFARARICDPQQLGPGYATFDFETSISSDNPVAHGAVVRPLAIYATTADASVLTG